MLKVGVTGPLLNILDNRGSPIVAIKGDSLGNEKNVAADCMYQCIAQSTPVVVIEREEGYFAEKATTTYVTDWVTVCSCPLGSPDLFHGAFCRWMDSYIHRRSTERPLEMVLLDTVDLLKNKEPQEELALMLKDGRTRNIDRPLVVIIDDLAAFLHDEESQESFDRAVRNARRNNVFFIVLWRAFAGSQERKLFERYQAYNL